MDAYLSTFIARTIPLAISFVLGALFANVTGASDLKQCRENLAAHDRFISLVVSDVERSVARTASVLDEVEVCLKARQ